jgi:hypothetical protein
MAIPETDLARIRPLLDQYCEARVPLHVRDKVTMGFSVQGSAITIFERRPGFNKPHDWHEEAIARFRYNATSGLWALYCMYRDLRWHRYDSHKPAKRFETLLAEVDADPTHIFWG